MALDQNINTLEKEKFLETSNSETAVRVAIAAGSGGITGEFTVSGLKIAGKVTVVTVNDATWTAIPTTALANRNAISIINRSGQQVKINYSPSIIGYVGVPIDNGSERFYDISDSIVVYCKSQTGSAELIVEELA